MLSPFDIHEVLHDSPLTRVLRATRRSDGARVVLKSVSHNDKTQAKLSRLRYEHGILRHLMQTPLPHVVRMQELVDTGDALALVLDDTGGYAVTHHLQLGLLPLPEVLKIAMAAAVALDGLHRSGVVHKDISANNIIYNRTTGTVELIDFGISSLLPRELQQVDSLWSLEGTPAYVSPEQTGRTSRPVDRRTDLYSLGVTLYEMLTGVLPFAQEDLGGLIYAILTALPVPPKDLQSTVSPALSHLVMRLLDKAPERRYSSARGLHADLQRCAAGETDFALGGEDREPTRELPQRLFGRAAQLQELSRMYQITSAGGVVVGMVAGPSGIGKSSLVQTLQTDMLLHQSLFIAGKHDQLQRHIPFSGFRQAIGMLVRHVLKEPASEVAAWRRRVQSALGNVGGVLLEIAPTLELLVGPQKAMPELGPQETENCLLMVLQRFIQALCAKQPLVIFLDDLQWADSGTLKLLKVLHSTTRGSAGVLFLGGYRSNEVSPDHPLAQALATLAENPDTAAQVIDLPPLGEEPVAELLAEASGQSAVECLDLARLLHAKTGGNPYFLHELVRHLWHIEALHVHPERRGWLWSRERLESTTLPDSVAALVSDRLRSLAPRTCDVLSLAACLGNEFACNDLAALVGESVAAIKALLTPALQAGLLVPAGNGSRYAADDDTLVRFAHDRVQEGAYALLPPDRAVATHLHVGRHLQAKLTPEKPVFEVLNHLNRALSLIVDAADRLDLAKLNLVGGREAKRAGAYSIALDFLSTASQALPSSAWAEQYDLNRELHFERAQCEFLNGNQEGALTTLDATLPHLRSAPEKSKVLGLKGRIFGVMARYNEGLDACEAGLRLLGHPIALRSPLTTARSLLTLKWIMRDASRIPALADAPRCTDENVIAALEMLRAALNFAYMASKVVLANACLNMALLNIRYGNSQHSANSYAALALVLTNLNDYAGASAYVDVAMTQLKTSVSPAEATFMAQGWVQFVRMDVATLYQGAVEGHAVARETGDPIVACFFTLLATVWLFHASLPRVEQEYAGFEAFVSLRNNRDYLRFLRVMRQAARCLLGKTHSPRSFVDDAYSEAESQQVMQIDDTLPAFMAMVFYIHRAWPEAIQGVQRGVKLQTLMQAPGMESLMFAFYGSLVYLAEARNAGRTRAPRGMTPLRKKLERACAAGSRYRGHCLLLEAEIAALEGKVAAAMRLYESAITELANAGRIDAQATAHECAGRFYLAQGAQAAGRAHLLQAHALYGTWGARVKEGLLEEEFPQLSFAPEVAVHKTATVSSNSRTTSEGDYKIDMPALMRVAQAIASEVAMPRLVQRILDGVGQISGATRTALFLSQGETSTVAADTQADVPIPLQIVHYAQRMREAVVVPDVSVATGFNDPVLKQTRARSLVCVPILHQGNCKGALYLENNAMAHAFAPARLTLVEMLAALAATALENSRTYTHLEEVVAQRTEELRDAHSRLLKLERDDTEMQMAGGFAHEVRNALAGTSFAVDSLAGKNADPEDEALIKLIREGIDRSMTITDDILSYAQVAQLVVNDDVVDLRNVVQTVLQDLSNELRAHKIECQLDLPEGCQLRVQEAHSYAMLRNLVSNAKDALINNPETQTSVLRISGRLTPQHAVLLVEDNGGGMPEAVQSRVFRPFFTTKGARGRGLGLGMARKLAQAYGGDLTFTSEFNKGTVFCLRLPRTER